MKHAVRALLAVVALAGAVTLVASTSRVPTRTIVAHFASTVGIHEGSDVRVLGVRIGSVASVVPEGRTVRVVMHYDATVPVPADASAAVIPPSVVSDRYVQLLPAYSGGPVLADGADLPLSRTAVPLELDDVYRALDQFNTALGPKGANSGGALRDLVATGAANLDGNGENLGATLDGFAKTLGTLADGRADLFGSLADLQAFVTALAQSDQRVRAFNDQLATVSEQLAGESQDLAAALRNLATALADITSFIRNNRDALKSNVDGLTEVTGILVRQQKALADVLTVAPLALSNLNLAYNGRSGTLDTRDDVMGPYDPASYVCSLLVDLVPVPQVPKECLALAQTLAAGHLPMTNELRRLAGLPPASSTGGSVPAAPGVPAPGAPGPSVGVGGGGPAATDPTLGGILGGTP
jgi:phospholipid/cholesterol/gamma-HCH transport system substrate-binding protein